MTRLNLKTAGECRAYSSWQAMMGRCYCKSASNYDQYEGSDIVVCDRWRDFHNFLADMGERPEGTTLERERRTGNYEPRNCRWATYKEQNENRSNNIWLTHNGETKTLTDWARTLQIPYSTFAARVKRDGNNARVFRPARGKGISCPVSK